MTRWLVVETRTDMSNPHKPGQPLRVVHGYRTVDAALILMGATARELVDEGVDLVPAAGLGMDIWHKGQLVGSLRLETQDLAVVGAQRTAETDLLEDR